MDEDRKSSPPVSGRRESSDVKVPGGQLKNNATSGKYQGVVDFDAIARAALADAERLVPQWLPDGRRAGAEYKPLNPKRGDGSPGSFSINLALGVWRDFAADVGGADLISLYAYINDLRQSDAAKALAEELHLHPAREHRAEFSSASGRGRPGTECVFPVPATAPALPVHPKYGAPSRIWEYRNAAGELCYCVVRFDPADDSKQFCPVTWRRTERTDRWEFRGPPDEFRMLYRLDRLTARPDAPVVICEGEKAADAAAELMPEHESTTSMNGSSAWKKTDWSALAGRSVIIWPDNDKPGRTYAHGIAAHLLGQIGAISVNVVRIPPSKPNAWDAADALAEGWTADTIAALMASGDFSEPFSPPQEPDTNAAISADEQLFNQHIERLASLSEFVRHSKIKSLSEEFEWPITVIKNALKQQQARLRALEKEKAKPGRDLTVNRANPWQSEVCPLDVLQEALDMFTAHAFLSEDAKTVLVLWALHTHLLPLHPYTPRLLIDAPVQDAGKSTVMMKLLLPLCYDWIRLGGINPSVIYRVSDKYRGCVLAIDEFDKIFNNRSITDRDLYMLPLNDGVEPGGGAIRCIGEENEPRVLVCDTPFVFAGVEVSPHLDMTTVTRTLIVSLRPAPPGSIPEPYVDAQHAKKYPILGAESHE